MSASDGPSVRDVAREAVSWPTLTLLLATASGCLSVVALMMGFDTVSYALMGFALLCALVSIGNSLRATARHRKHPAHGRRRT